MADARPGKATLSIYGRTDAGFVRAANEDAFLIANLATHENWQSHSACQWAVEGGGILLAVSDGMGGHNAGDVASSLAIEELRRAMESAAGGDGGRALVQAIEHASRRVHQVSVLPQCRGMGATMTAILLRDDGVFVAEVGDSRAYLVRGSHICQVTHDQSYVQMLVDLGVMSPEEAERSPQRNVIMQSVGQEKALRVALGRLSLLPGDRLVLCSDGLSNELRDDEITHITMAETRVESACARLVNEALGRGGRDNITVIVAELAGELPGDVYIEPPCNSVTVVQSFVPSSIGLPSRP